MKKALSTREEYIRVYKHAWYQANKARMRVRAQEWRLRNPEKVKSSARKKYLKNRDKILAEQKIRRTKNRSTYSVDRRRSDSIFRITCNLRSRLNRSLHGNYKSGSAIRDLGCSIPELKQWLEAQFKPGMSWDNYGDWHIDHILPLSSFDLADPKQLKKACHWFNLQPLWAKDNISKGNRV